MPAFIETQKDPRIEFGQIRETQQSPTQLTFNLDNAAQTTLFDSNPEQLKTEYPLESVEFVIFNNQASTENVKNSKGQLDLNSFGAFSNSDPDQLLLHYTQDEDVDFEENKYDNLGTPFRRSAILSRRRNRFRQL